MLKSSFYRTFLEVSNRGMLCYCTEKGVSTKVRGRRYDKVLQILGRVEAVACGCSSKQVFLKISQISR